MEHNFNLTSITIIITKTFIIIIITLVTVHSPNPLFSLHSWQRSANPAILLRPLSTPPLFFIILSTPAPTSLSPTTPNLTALSVVMFLWLNGWSRHIWCTILLNDNIDLYMSSLGTLVPEGPWCVFYATGRQVYWGFLWVLSDLVSHTHANTQQNLTFHHVFSKIIHL